MNLRRMPGRTLLAPLVGLAITIGAIVALSMLFEAILPWEHLPWGGVEAPGRIVAHQPVAEGSGRVYAVIAFSTADDEYLVVERSATRVDALPVGTQVTVLYPPGQPETAQIGSHAERTTALAIATCSH